ncbi:MAG: hypothetical protein ACPGVY_13840 [Mycobacterium sp.]
MTSPTPGPWRVDPAPYDQSAYQGVIGRDGQTVAAIGGKDQAEAVANAHLIAAAPDLLDALRFAETVLTRIASGDGSWSGDDVAAVAGVAVGAIAKATAQPAANEWGQPSLVNDKLWALTCDLRIAADSIQALGASADPSTRRAHRARDIVERACLSRRLADLMDAARRESDRCGGSTP